MISILTPTSERDPFLKLLYSALLKQTFSNWEWLILDSSWPPCSFKEIKDPRVRYFHTQEKLAIGEKRNFLKNQAHGDILVHFDDDDYYAPGYLSTVAEKLKSADFFTLSGWFCYDLGLHQYYYWSTEENAETFFILDPLSGGKVREVHLGEKWIENQSAHLLKKAREGFGFSYAYRKQIAQKIDFEAINNGEDLAFYREVERQGFKRVFLSDETGLALHVIHDMNVSRSLPQYRLPSFIGKRLFPDAPDYTTLFEHCS